MNSGSEAARRLELADLTAAQSRAIRVVDQGLATLERNWGHGARPEAVYGLAAVLRDLLVHGSFARAWGLVWEPGRRPKITVVAPDLAELVPEGMDRVVVFAQTAGFARPGIHLWMPVGLSEAASPPSAGVHDDRIGTEADSTQTNPGEAQHKISAERFSVKLEGAIMSGLIDQESVPLAPESCYRRYTLPKFLASPCLVHRGQRFTRRSVVSSFANNLGAAHIDWEGRSAEYDMLTNNEWLEITGRSPALYEVLSIGQILSRSASAALFRNRVAGLGLEPLR